MINSELLKFNEVIKGVKICNTLIVQFTKFNYSFNVGYHMKFSVHRKLNESSLSY